MIWHERGATIAHADQVVLESDPPRRLSYTWHTFTPEWAAAVGVDEELRAKIAAERRSRVRFELEPDGPLVKLTVVHDDFDEGSTVAEMVSGGWPRVVGEIKTLLEAGGSDAEGFGVQLTVAEPVADVLAALTTLDGLGGLVDTRRRRLASTRRRADVPVRRPSDRHARRARRRGRARGLDLHRERDLRRLGGHERLVRRAAASRRRLGARVPPRRPHPRSGVLRGVQARVGASPGEPGRDRFNGRQ